MASPLAGRDREGPRWAQVGWSLLVLACALDAGAALAGADNGGVLWGLVNAGIHEGTQAVVLTLWPAPSVDAALAPGARIDTVIRASVAITLLAPSAAFGVALRWRPRRQPLRRTLLLLARATWAAVTSGHMARYIADAPHQSLELTSSRWSLPLHDWGYLLDRLHAMDAAGPLRVVMRGTGALWWIAAMTVGVAALWALPAAADAPPDGVA